MFKSRWIALFAVGLLLGILAWGASPAHTVWAAPTDNACEKSNECWVVTYLGAASQGGGVTQLTFRILPKPDCNHNVSYVAFGFPASWGISSPTGGTYIGPNTGISFSVVVPAGGQVPDPTSIKFVPQGTWSPGNAEVFVFNVTGYNATDPVNVYGHAGGGPTPAQVTFTNLAQGCTPAAVTLNKMVVKPDAMPVWGVGLIGLAVLAGSAVVVRARRRAL